MALERNTQPNIELDKIMRLEREKCMNPEQLKERRNWQARISEPRLYTGKTLYSLIERAADDIFTFGDLPVLYAKISGEFERVATLALEAGIEDVAEQIFEAAGMHAQAAQTQAWLEAKFYAQQKMSDEAIKGLRGCGYPKRGYEILLKENLVGTMLKYAHMRGEKERAGLILPHAEERFKKALKMRDRNSLEELGQGLIWHYERTNRFDKAAKVADILGDHEASSTYFNLVKIMRG